MGRKVIVVPHNPDWVWQYDEEAVCLTAVFQPILNAIYHISRRANPKSDPSRRPPSPHSKQKRAFLWRKKQVAI